MAKRTIVAAVAFALFIVFFLLAIAAMQYPASDRELPSAQDTVLHEGKYGMCIVNADGTGSRNVTPDCFGQFSLLCANFFSRRFRNILHRVTARVNNICRTK